MLNFFTSVEFYVVLAVVAGAIVAFAAKPPSAGPVREFLLAGEIYRADFPWREGPAIELYCHDDGKVTLVRHGLTQVNASGAVSLAIKVKGFDIDITERIVSGSQYSDDEPVDTAMFTLDFLGRERYHLRYNSDRTNLFAAFQLHVRPGIRSVHELVR